MKKLIFLIPFMLVLSSCGDTNSSTPSNINSDQTSGQVTAGIGGGDITPNPDGDNPGSTGGSTTNPADTSDTGNDESGTSTDPVNPGSDDTGTSTNPVNPGSDESGTSTDPENPGGDDTGTPTDPAGTGSDESGTTTDPVNPGDEVDVEIDNPDGSGGDVDVEIDNPGGSGGEVDVEIDNPGGSGGGVVVVIPDGDIYSGNYINEDPKTFIYPVSNNYYRSLLSIEEQEVYDYLMEKFIKHNQIGTDICASIDSAPSCQSSTASTIYTYNVCRTIVTGQGYKNIIGQCNYYEKITRFEVNFQERGIKVTPENLEKIAKYVLIDEPRTFFVASNVASGKAYGNITPVETDNSGYVTKAYFEYKGYNDYYDLLNRLDNNLNSIQEVVKNIDSATSSVSLYESVDKLKKYLEAFQQAVTFDTSGADTLKGLLNDRKLNAKGYARSLSYVLRLSGLYDIIYVEGTANYTTGAGSQNGASFDHAWLKLKLYGTWYNLDPVRNSNGDGSLYNFLQSDEEFYKDHTPYDKTLLPVSSSSYTGN